MSYKKNIVASGETGQTTLASHSLLCGAGASAVSLIPTGSSGQLLQSAGSSSDPGWTTPTYPSVGGTNRQLLMSNGTNNVYTTETWATPGTSGNVLTSDGTNWTSAAAPGGGLLMASGTLTSSQIKNLHGTPIQAIAAPGSGKTIVIVNSSSKLNYGGTNAFVAGASQTIRAYYNSTTSALLQIATNTQITSTQNYSNIGSTPGNISGASTNYSNQPITLYNDVATEISGNAANNNTLDWYIQYYIVNY